jgi:hypothetical protein
MAHKQRKKTQEISVIHFSEYNLPSIKESNNKDWIEFGVNNNYPDYLLELYNGSSINNAVIKGVSAMIYGEGLEATDREDSDEHKEQWLRLLSLLNRSKKDILKCLAFDLKLFGLCYVNIIWNKPRTRIVELKHCPAQYIRAGKSDAYGDVTDYFYSANWELYKKSEYKPRCYKAFNSEDRTDASQILCIKDYSPGTYYYSLPDYQGSTSYIQLDMEIAQFHLSNIKSGMFPSMAINFANGIPTREERQKIERQVNAKFAGSGNAGKILLTFNDGKDTAPEIMPLNANDSSDSYQFLSSETTRKILTGHRVTSPLLFGVKGDGSGFGNNADELRDSYSLFNNTVIKPFQNTLLDSLKQVFAINDVNLDLYFKSLKPADFIDLENTNKLDEDEQEKEGIDTGDPIRKEFSVEVTDDNEKVCLDYFDNVGITLPEDEWFEAHSEVVDINTDNASYHEFAYAPAGTPNQMTEWSDIGLFRLLYRYSTNLSHNSRVFCQKMVAKAQAGTLYTVEDLINAGSKAVNKGFGPHGASTYSIFFYKGGPNCKHHWERVWYFRKQVPQGHTIIGDDGKEYKGGDFLPNGTLNNFKKVSQGFANSKGVIPKVPDGLAETTPWHMPNHGYLKPR